MPSSVLVGLAAVACLVTAAPLASACGAYGSPTTMPWRQDNSEDGLGDNLQDGLGLGHIVDDLLVSLAQPLGALLHRASREYHPTPHDADPAPYKMGDTVLGNWQGQGRAYRGHIVGINPDNTFALHYNDGDKENNVPASRIKCASPSDKPCGGAKSSGSAVADHMEDAEGLERMVFKGNGCCRFNGWKGINKGYVSEAACTSSCLAADNCAAADMARPNGDKTHCFHFVGDAAHSSFKEQCDTQDLTQKCFRKEKAAAAEAATSTSAATAAAIAAGTAANDARTAAEEVDETTEVRGEEASCGYGIVGGSWKDACSKLSRYAW